ncbi:hypothetical protein [Verrucomicrobium spinosum]|nr:hypothetical protein [Verrucomicrobium spinosum]
MTYRFGLYHYTTATATRVVHAADVVADDLRASDWTLQGWMRSR